MYCDLKEVLTLAEDGGYCVPAFNIYNVETARGVIRAAEETRSPVILQVYSRLVTTGLAADLAPSVIDIARRASIPVCFHLDHGEGEREVVRSLRLGLSGIMIDASAEKLDQNIEITARTVKMCGDVGVYVEGELGHIGKAADGDETVAAEFTDPKEAERYVAETGVAALAIMVGTAHGRYKQAPVLDIARIEEIKRRVKIPLVLHGGSGVPDEQIKAAIQAGIRKMNFGTDLCFAFLDACRARDKSVYAIDLFMAEPERAVAEFAKTRISVLGSAGRV